MFDLTKVVSTQDNKTIYYLINEVGNDFHRPIVLLHENEMKHIVDCYNRMNSDKKANNENRVDPNGIVGHYSQYIIQIKMGCWGNMQYLREGPQQVLKEVENIEATAKRVGYPMRVVRQEIIEMVLGGYYAVNSDNKKKRCRKKTTLSGKTK